VRPAVVTPRQHPPSLIHAVFRVRFEEPYFDFACLKHSPAAGEWFYSVCGTSYGAYDEPGFSEYWFVTVAVCFLGMALYTHIFCYPRSFYLVWWGVCRGKLPMCYKSLIPAQEQGELAEILGYRGSGPASGQEEYLVTRRGREEEPVWETKHALQTDGDGPSYGEGGGLYGSHGGGSSRERIHRYRQLRHAEERLAGGWLQSSSLRRGLNGGHPPLAPAAGAASVAAVAAEAPPPEKPRSRLRPPGGRTGQAADPEPAPRARRSARVPAKKSE